MVQEWQKALLGPPVLEVEDVQTFNLLTYMINPFTISQNATIVSFFHRVTKVSYLCLSMKGDVCQTMSVLLVPTVYLSI